VVFDEGAGLGGEGFVEGGVVEEIGEMAGQFFDRGADEAGLVG